MNKIKKLFGGIDLSWKNLIIFAIVAGVYTAVMALIPGLKYTSFSTIVATYEVWILFGIIIIMNSKSNIDSALKCFVFFLISQPLVYLLQVPFNELGWGLFGYYKFWFILTIACIPMGFIGYFIKKDKWYGYLILLPMIFLTLVSYYTYFKNFTFDYPRYFLISLFCVVVSLIYPIVIFNNKTIKKIGVVVSAVAIIAVTAFVFANPYVYTTEIMSMVDGRDITEDYSVELEDDKFGEASIEYIEELECYMVHVDFKRSGHTKLIVTTPEGETKLYDLAIARDTFTIEAE